MILRLVAPDRAVARSTQNVRRESRLVRRANVELRRRTGGRAGSEAIPFLCECRLAGCETPVVMSAAAFDAVLAATGGWVIAAGHKPPPRRSPLSVPHPAAVGVGAPVFDRREGGDFGDDAA